MNKILSIEEQAKRFEKDFSDFKQGKITFKQNKFHISRLADDISPKELKKIRENQLHVSQKILADSLGVSVRTLQGWEIGKSKPIEPVIRLLLLIRDEPKVREKLLPVSA